MVDSLVPNSLYPELFETVELAFVALGWTSIGIAELEFL